VLTSFGMIWNYEKNSKQNTKSNKINALSKIRISPNLIVKKHMTYWGNYKYNIQKVPKHFIWKFLFRKTCFLRKMTPKKTIVLNVKQTHWLVICRLDPIGSYKVYTYRWDYESLYKDPHILEWTYSPKFQTF